MQGHEVRHKDSGRNVRAKPTCSGLAHDFDIGADSVAHAEPRIDPEDA